MTVLSELHFGIEGILTLSDSVSYGDAVRCSSIVVELLDNVQNMSEVW